MPFCCGAERGAPDAASLGSAPREMRCFDLCTTARTGFAQGSAEEAEAPRPRIEPGAGSRAPAQPPPPSALTVAEAERSQHEGQHGDDLGIHGTGGRR